MTKVYNKENKSATQFNISDQTLKFNINDQTLKKNPHNVIYIVVCLESEGEVTYMKSWGDHWKIRF